MAPWHRISVPPHFSSDLVAALAGLKVDNLPHGVGVVEARGRRGRVEEGPLRSLAGLRVPRPAG
jgi:hypothetical protein